MMMRAITFSLPPSSKTTGTATATATATGFSCSRALFMELEEATGLRSASPSPLSNSKICVPANFSITCSSSSSSSSRRRPYIPKLEPFCRTRTMLERAIDPPLIQKTLMELSDYCTTLEGDECYSCWRAYFELKELEKECPKEEVERLIQRAVCVESLVDCVHYTAEIYKEKKESGGAAAIAKAVNTEKEQQQVRRMPMHIPDGLPKSTEEMEEEEKARMPDSQYTRLLRHIGRHSARYSPLPDY